MKTPRTLRASSQSKRTSEHGGICFAELGSLTLAMKAQDALAAAAIPVSVEKNEKKEKTESAASGRGCSYGIRFSCLQENNVRAVLSDARISVKRWNEMD